jgi:hypothetical protein
MNGKSRILLYLLLFLIIFNINCKNEENSNVPVLTTTAVTYIGEDFAKLGGTITSDGGSPIIERGICWSDKRNPVITDSHKADSINEKGTFSILTYGLSAWTLYFVRAYAKNSSGIGYGLVFTFCTINGYSFKYQIQPLFTAHCCNCHSGSINPDLRENKAYFSLNAGNYINRTVPELSKLYLKITTGSMQSYGTTPAENSGILRWISFGADYN